MIATRRIPSSDILNLSNNVLSDLKSSYPIWEDLVTKSGKFHSSLKLSIQSCSAFIDSLQRVAEAATRTIGGSRDIGTSLNRLCLRQRKLESKLKSLNNHLITSLATPLGNKIDEWRRTLSQLEKDHAKQTKRARSELKRAISEANRWQKKASKHGASTGTDLGPGIGHGIQPTASERSRVNATAVQASVAAHEVAVKTQSVQSAELSTMRSLILEERGRFCFFVSCLLPILECQSSILSDFSAIDEIVNSLSKSVDKPNELLDDVETIIINASCRDLSRTSSVKASLYLPDQQSANSMIVAATAAMLNNSDRIPTGSSDTDSGRVTMDAVPTAVGSRKPDDTCSLSSSTQFQIRLDSRCNNIRCNSVCDGTSLSLGGVSSHSSSGGGSNAGGYGTSALSCAGRIIPDSVDLIPNGDLETTLQASNTTGSLSSCKSSLQSMPLVVSMDYSAISNEPQPCSPHSIANDLCQPECDDPQFQTLCRPTHYRSAIGGVGPGQLSLFHPGLHNNPSDSVFASISNAISGASQLTNHSSCSSSYCVGGDTLLNENLNHHDEASVEKEEYEEYNSSEELLTGDEVEQDGGDYVEFKEPIAELQKQQQHQQVAIHRNDPVIANSQSRSNGNYPLTTAQTAGLNFGRHTISTAYERGGPSSSRTPISTLSFNAPIGKSSSKDSGVDSSTVLYPNQALPPPVYTNLTQLAHAAQRKFSISQLPGSNIACLQNSQASCSTDRSCSVQTSYLNRNDQITTAHQPSKLRPTTQSMTDFKQTDAQTNFTNRITQLQLCNPGVTACVGSPFTTEYDCNHNPLNSPARLPHSSAANFRRGSNGTDPFSVDLDELDKLVVGSSCASSLTIASSTTSESQPSANGVSTVHRGSLHQQQRRSSEMVQQNNAVTLLHSSDPELKQPSEATESAPASLRQQSDPPSLPPPPFSWSGQTQMGKINSGGQLGTGGPSNSAETTNLMSELSSQLKQMALHNNGQSEPDFPNDALSTKRSSGDFALPPPPPQSMFHSPPDSVHLVELYPQTGTGNRSLFAAPKHSMEQRATRIAMRDHSAPPRPR